MREGKKILRQRDKEGKGKMLTCLRAAATESWREGGRREHHGEARAAHRCQAALCPGAGGRVTLSRTGRGVYTSSSVSESILSLSLFMRCISEETSGASDMLGDTWSDLDESVFLGYECTNAVQEHQKQT